MKRIRRGRIPTALLLALLAVSCTAPIPPETSSPPQTEQTESAETTAAPAVTETELFAEAVGLTNFKNGMTGQKATAYGTGAFADYTYVHANPTAAADLPMQMTAAAATLSPDSAGLGAFLTGIAGEFAWQTDLSAPDYPRADTVEGALALLFAAAGTEDGLPAAQAAAENLRDEVKPALCEYLSAAAFAFGEYRRESFKIPPAEYAALTAYSFCPPASDDCSPMQRIVDTAALADERALLTAGVCAADAASRLAQSLAGCASLTKDGAPLILETPAGRIVFGTAEDDVYADAAAFLLVDPGGCDAYGGRAAASVAQDKPLSVLIDLAGDDAYTAGADDGLAQGSGLFGAGILLDLSGNDTYAAVRCAQGFAIAGTGILFDGGGDDTYTAEVSAQSCAVHGLSLLADVAGDDTYSAYAYAQGSAGNRAVALITDLAGDDLYRVEPYEAAGYEGLLYGQFAGANGCWSQGCGAGNRNVTSAARGVSGGIAGLIDLSGDDRYNGGIWTQGVGYWSGIGFLCDTAGDDTYNAHYYSQASVAHYGVGVLLDVGGDDTHTLVEGKVYAGEGAALGFVWDRGVALYVNDGGSDVYRTGCYAFGASWSAYDGKGMLSQDQTYAIFLDTAGDDYYTDCAEPAFGRGRGGFFLDLGGYDFYGHKGSENDATLYGVKRECGIFIDREPADGETFTVEFWENAKRNLLQK